MRWERGDRGKGVQYIQEWLCLQEPGVLIDGQFGVATEYAVRVFQNRNGLPSTGVVDDATWNRLTEPQRRATAAIGAASLTFSGAVLACAERHLNAKAREVGGPNTVD